MLAEWEKDCKGEEMMRRKDFDDAIFELAYSWEGNTSHTAQVAGAAP